MMYALAPITLLYGIMNSRTKNVGSCGIQFFILLGLSGFGIHGEQESIKKILLLIVIHNYSEMAIN